MRIQPFVLRLVGGIWAVAFALFVDAVPARADSVSACVDILGVCEGGNTSVTFTTQSSSQVTINIASFLVSPGLVGPGTIDTLGGSATLFGNGSALGEFFFNIDTTGQFPFPELAQIAFTNWSETGTPGDMTLAIFGTATFCDIFCEIGGPPETGGIGGSSVSIFVPEPASLILLGSGLGLLCLGPALRRRVARP